MAQFPAVTLPLDMTGGVYLATVGNDPAKGYDSFLLVRGKAPALNFWRVALDAPDSHGPAPMAWQMVDPTSITAISAKLTV